MALNRWGVETTAWDQAKSEAKALLGVYAKRRQMLTYTDFVRRIKSIQLEPDDFRLRHFLSEISSEEFAAGRGMLTVLVVHKTGDFQPGPGFFDLAVSLGHTVTDVEKFWIQEVKRVFAAWAQ